MSESSPLFRRALARRTTYPEPVSEPPRLAPLAPHAEEPALSSRAPSPPVVVDPPPRPSMLPPEYRLAEPSNGVEILAHDRRRRWALVVEDDDVLREGTALLLADAGWTIVDARTLDGARALLAAFRPDVLVLDYDLHGEYASVLLDEVLHQGRAVPTLLVSASPLAIDAARGYHLDLLQKPFDLDSLVRAVAAVAETRVLPRRG